VPGAVVGGLVLGVFDNIVATDVSATWRDAIVYGLIIAILLLRAGSLLGRRILVRA
jgi:branched-subunit amino acid ABC-type transport system permease component